MMGIKTEESERTMAPKKKGYDSIYHDDNLFIRSFAIEQSEIENRPGI
jgi:hypothetical protein